jgi:uncharacterized protein YjbI with pentapeptide repeats
MKNKIYSRSVRMTAVNTREFETNSLGSNHTTLSNADVKNYSGVDFSNVTDFTEISFKGANLKRAVFDNLDFENELNNNNGKQLKLPLDKSKLDFLDFSGAKLYRTSFIDTKMPNANFQGATITTSFFDGADLSGANFSGLTMTDVSFSSAILKGANFSKTRIIHRLEYSDIDFNDADFTNADFSGANFDYSEYNYANFTNANFTSSKINGTFTGAIFDGTIFNSATLQGSFQVGDKNKEKSKIFKNVDFSYANLEKISFSYYPNEIKIILRNVDFSYASFSRTYDIFFDDDAKELAVKFENTTCPNGETTNNRC